jgi:hypothetical protein
MKMHLSTSISKATIYFLLILIFFSCEDEKENIEKNVKDKIEQDVKDSVVEIRTIITDYLGCWNLFSGSYNNGSYHYKFETEGNAFRIRKSEQFSTKISWLLNENGTIFSLIDENENKTDYDVLTNENDTIIIERLDYNFGDPFDTLIRSECPKNIENYEHVIEDEFIIGCRRVLLEDNIHQELISSISYEFFENGSVTKFENYGTIRTTSQWNISDDKKKLTLDEEVYIIDQYYNNKITLFDLEKKIQISISPSDDCIAKDPRYVPKNIYGCWESDFPEGNYTQFHEDGTATIIDNFRNKVSEFNWSLSTFGGTLYMVGLDIPYQARLYKNKFLIDTIREDGKMIINTYTDVDKNNQYELLQFFLKRSSFCSSDSYGYGDVTARFQYFELDEFISDSLTVLVEGDFENPFEPLYINIDSYYTYKNKQYLINLHYQQYVNYDEELGHSFWDKQEVNFSYKEEGQSDFIEIEITSSTIKFKDLLPNPRGSFSFKFIGPKTGIERSCYSGSFEIEKDF